MTASIAQLEEANCSFSTDRVKDPLMAAFKQEARYRQYQWAASSQGITRFGSHRNTKRGILAGGPALIDNGTKLTAEDAAAGKNFLSEEIRYAVEDRIAHPQGGETFDVPRLCGDLLSSMPMAFNLFGEASRHEESKQALSTLLAPGSTGSVEIVFEWSPQRRSDKYTGDRTAFDVALQIGTGPKTVVGIETKYHEHAQPEKKPNAKQQSRYTAQTMWLAGIADGSAQSLVDA